MHRAPRRARGDERRRGFRARAELGRHPAAPDGRGHDPEAEEPQRVTGAKIATNAVTGALVRNGVADEERLRGQLAARRAGRSRGPAGPAGTVGPITVRSAGVAVPGGAPQNGAYDTETVTVNCNANEKAISAGTGWSDDAADRELWTQRIQPIVTNNEVTGYRGTGGNDSGNTSTFTLYVLCYVG